MNMVWQFMDFYFLNLVLVCVQYLGGSEKTDGPQNKD